MSKNLKILINFTLYILCFLVVCLVGSSNVFAVGITNYSTKYYYGNADSTNTYSTDYRTDSDNKVSLNGGTAPTYSNSETFTGFYNRINYSITKGSIYTLSLAVSYSNLQNGEFGETNVNNRLLNIDFAHCSDCTITAVSGSIRRYNNTNASINGLYDYVVQMSYTFIATSDASTWYIGTYTNDDRTLGVSSHTYRSIVMINNLDISNDNSSTIINQNDTIISQNQEIINQNNQNTQTIIDNQNELLGDSCSNLYVSRLPSTTECGITVAPNDDGSYTLNGTSTCGIDFRLDQTSRNGSNNLFSLSKGTYTLSSNTLPNGLHLNVMQQNTWVNYFFNDINTSTNTNTLDSNVNDLFIYIYIDNGTTLNNFVIKPMLVEGSTSKSYCEYGTYSSKLDDTNNAINNLDDTLKDDNVDENGVADAFDSFNDFLDDNSTITQLITLPITLYTAILNNVNGSCQPFNLGQLYGENLILPCINVSQYLGNTLWSMIDIIISGFAIFAISKKMIKVFNNFSSLREGDVIDD